MNCGAPSRGLTRRQCQTHNSVLFSFDCRLGPTHDWLRSRRRRCVRRTVIAVRCFDNAETYWLRPPIPVLAALALGHHKSEHELVAQALPVDRTHYRPRFLDLSRSAQGARFNAVGNCFIALRLIAVRLGAKRRCLAVTTAAAYAARERQ